MGFCPGPAGRAPAAIDAGTGEDGGALDAGSRGGGHTDMSDSECVTFDVVPVCGADIATKKAKVLLLVLDTVTS